jgi:G3E family GTPase
MKVILVTGPLGSGKTVRVNQILASAKIYNQTVLCVVNDIGQENIDAQRLQSVGEILPLTQGCICCDSVSVLEETILEASKKEIDFILIEPTGIADARVIHEIATSIKLDWSCLSLLDVKHFSLNKAIGSEQFQLPVATEVGLTWADEFKSVEDPELNKILEYIGFYTQAPVVLLEKDSLDIYLTKRLFFQKSKELASDFVDGAHKMGQPVRPTSIFLDKNVNETLLFPVLQKLYTEKGLVRAKGISLFINYDDRLPGYYAWDFVQGNIQVSKNKLEKPERLSANFIGLEKGIIELLLPLIDKKAMCDVHNKYKDQIDAFIGDIPGVPLEDTIKTIHYLLEQYPNPVTKDGRVLTNCDADPAKHLARRTGVPRELHEHAYRTSVEWRINGFKHLVKQYKEKSWSDNYSFYRSSFILGKALINTLEIDWVNELMTDEIRNEILSLPVCELMLLGLDFMLGNNTKEIMEIVKPDSISRNFSFCLEHKIERRSLEEILKQIKKHISYSSYSQEDWDKVVF